MKYFWLDSPTQLLILHYIKFKCIIEINSKLYRPLNRYNDSLKNVIRIMLFYYVFAGVLWPSWRRRFLSTPKVSYLGEVKKRGLKIILVNLEIFAIRDEISKSRDLLLISRSLINLEILNLETANSIRDKPNFFLSSRFISRW